MPDVPPAGPTEVLASLVDTVNPLADDIRAVVQPIQHDRDEVRAFFEDRGYIRPLDTTLHSLPTGGADGAYLTDQTIVGDVLASLAVAVHRSPDGDITVTDHRHWSRFVPHGADNKTMAKAVMMAHEQVLISSLPTDTVKIIDGSHVTPLIGILMGLASPEDHVRDQIVDIAMDERLSDAVARNATDDNTVACPKSDSSLDLWEECSQALNLHGIGIPDKALATLVLNPGEMLVNKRTPPASWKRLYKTLEDVSDGRAKIVARRIAEAIEPLRSGEIAVHHVMPEGAPNALRVELHPGLDAASDEMIASLTHTLCPPFVQEPLTQHLADTFAKTLSVLSDVQMEQTRFALVEQGTPEYLEFLAHYRTQ